MRRRAWILACALLGCSRERHPEVTPPVGRTAEETWREPRRSSERTPILVARCRRNGPLPDAACTPGLAMTSDLDVVCHETTRKRRHVDDALRRKVFALYGDLPAGSGRFEVDHLIPLELGGSNAVENLWPEPAEPEPGFHEKDHLETWLHERVCSGAMPLTEAQRVIASDWVRVWREIGGAETPPWGPTGGEPIE